MAKISENKISPQLGLRKEINASLEEVSAKFVVSNVEQLSSAQISELKAGDIVLKEDSSGKHSYIVSYKKDGTGICLTYTDASCVETVSYDFTGGQWVFNSKDVTPISTVEGNFSGSTTGATVLTKLKITTNGTENKFLIPTYVQRPPTLREVLTAALVQGDSPVEFSEIDWNDDGLIAFLKFNDGNYHYSCFGQLTINDIDNEEQILDCEIFTTIPVVSDGGANDVLFKFNIKITNGEFDDYDPYTTKLGGSPENFLTNLEFYIVS